MISNDRIQAGLISYLKSKTVLTNKLTACGSGGDEIREDNWKGREFSYPVVRVAMLSNTSSDKCEYSEFTCAIMVFSEKASSKEADEISGIISTILHNKGFTSNSIAFSTVVTNLVPSMAQSERVWRSEILLRGIAS